MHIEINDNHSVNLPSDSCCPELAETKTVFRSRNVMSHLATIAKLLLNNITIAIHPDKNMEFNCNFSLIHFLHDLIVHLVEISVSTPMIAAQLKSLTLLTITHCFIALLVVVPELLPNGAPNFKILRTVLSSFKFNRISLDRSLFYHCISQNNALGGGAWLPNTH